MNRISRHVAFMRTAEVWACRSTCMRRAIGAVMAVGNHIVAQAYNGPAPGEEHCTGKGCAPDNICRRAIHAEVNAINRTAQPYNRSPNRVLYTTESPCMACAARIVAERVSAVYFLNLYRDQAGVNHLVTQRIPTFRMTPAGYIINHATGELVDE